MSQRIQSDEIERVMESDSTTTTANANASTDIQILGKASSETSLLMLIQEKKEIEVKHASFVNICLISLMSL